MEYSELQFYAQKNSVLVYQGVWKNLQIFKKEERKIISNSSLALIGMTSSMIALTSYCIYLNLNSLELWYYAVVLVVAGYLKNASVAISAFSIW